MSEKSRLYINKLTLYNYRTYVGENQLDLSPEPSKPITVIHGNNGRGKTTILNAIVWALYGKERDFGLDVDEGRINAQVMEDLEVNESAKAYVELWLNDDEGPKYYIRRTIEAAKTANLEKTREDMKNASRVNEGFDINEELTVMYRPDGKGEFEKVEDALSTRIISKIFPEELSSYILFDAELLREVLTQEGNLVRKGIEEISGLPLIDQTADDLTKAFEIIKKPLRKDVEIDRLEEKKKNLKQSVEELEARKQNCDKETQLLTKQYNDCLRFLGQHGMPDIRKKKDRLRELKSIEKELQSNLAAIKNELQDFVMVSFYQANLRKEIDIVLQKFRAWEEDGLIPPPVNKTTLDKIMKSVPPVCICGRVIDQDSDAMREFKKMRKKVMSNMMVQEIIRGRDQLSTILDGSSNTNIRQQYESQKNEIAERRLKLNKVIEEQKAIAEYLSKNSEKEIEECGLKMMDNRNKDRENTGERTRVALEIEDANKKLQSCEKELKSAVLKNKNNEKVRKNMNLCQATILQLRKLKEELLRDFKLVTEDTTSKYFLSFAPRKEDFKEVKILDGYRLCAVDKNGRVKKLSAGQSHCLGLSYISAIRQITKKNYFIMIDSPFHNISQAERLELVRQLSQYLKNTQLTLLVTDTEYTSRPFIDITGSELESVRDMLINQESLWGEYLLQKEGHAKTTSTKIVRSHYVQ